jgi:hypothetical protein
MTTRIQRALHIAQPDTNKLGLAAALAALLFVFPDATAQTPAVDQVVVFGVFVMSAFLTASGVFNRIPVAEYVRPWDEQFDELRDRTEWFTDFADSLFGGLRESWSDAPRDWRDYAKAVPLPDADERPLEQWGSYLLQHESESVRNLMVFAERLDLYRDVSSYRRFAVRTYDRFGLLLLAGKDGFAEWMDAEDVEAGAADLVSILAYLEIARAVRKPIGKPGRRREGFWYLAARWHPETVALPRS